MLQKPKKNVAENARKLHPNIVLIRDLQILLYDFYDVHKEKQKQILNICNTRDCRQFFSDIPDCQLVAGCSQLTSSTKVVSSDERGWWQGGNNNNNNNNNIKEDDESQNNNNDNRNMKTNF